MIPSTYMNPVYGVEEVNSVADYMSSGGWIMEHTKTREMEQLICDYTGARFAHMVPSATQGLVLASMLAELKPDEQFAVPAYTQAATANGGILMGAKPVIVDVDSETYTIDFEQIPDTVRVVFVASINGRLPADAYEQIRRLQARGCFVIEDAAQSLGSWIGNRHCGTIGDVGVFSFGAPKIITTGQGGCIVTDNQVLSERITAIKNFGRTVRAGEVYNVFGSNFKFTDLQAAFGCEQMRKLPSIAKHKKDIFQKYRQNLEFYCDFVNTNLSEVTPTYPEILVDNQTELVEILKRENIGCRTCYSSLSSQPYHSQFATPTPVADSIANRGIILPSQADLELSTVDEICRLIVSNV